MERFLERYCTWNKTYDTTFERDFRNCHTQQVWCEQQGTRVLIRPPFVMASRQRSLLKDSIQNSYESAESKLSTQQIGQEDHLKCKLRNCLMCSSDAGFICTRWQMGQQQHTHTYIYINIYIYNIYIYYTHTYIHSEYYDRITCICILFLFMVWRRLESRKHTHQLRALPKSLPAAIIFRAMTAMMLAPNSQCSPTLSFFAPRTGSKSWRCLVGPVLFCSVKMGVY